MAKRRRKHKFELIPGWQHAWRMYTTWIFALLGSIGDLYNFCHDMGFFDDGKLPPQFLWILRITATVGVVARLIRQKRLRDKINESRRRKRQKARKRTTKRSPATSAATPSDTGSSAKPV
jgi:hypothetical protein